MKERGRARGKGLYTNGGGGCSAARTWTSPGRRHLPSHSPRSIRLPIVAWLWGLPTAVSAQYQLFFFPSSKPREKSVSPEVRTLSTADSLSVDVYWLRNHDRMQPESAAATPWRLRSRHTPTQSPAGQSASHRPTTRAGQCSVVFRGSQTSTGEPQLVNAAAFGCSAMLSSRRRVFIE